MELAKCELVHIFEELVMLTTYLGYEKKENLAERRSEGRVKLNGKALVQVIKTNDPALSDTAFHAGVLNASSSGLCLTAEQRLDDCELEIWVGLEGHSQKLYLTCEVIWTSWEDENNYNMGVEVIRRQGTDYADWLTLFDG